MYIPATAGPIELPIILISIFIPKEIPIDCLGVTRVTTFIAPTFIKDIPAETIARFTETAISDECIDERTKKPTTIIMLPAIIGFIEPNLDIKTPEVEPKIKSTSAKGN
jgi:hypothetical protein